ncbi:hypothetical protein GCK72_010771 [Caenorhabditis remanei]|uniref:XPG-I domain-containing protein n=1 Tax=Caenorhabditis remanei TaxID=31234 RepID=A0A6A5H636_CAERE|nr:hypothetical protein GCK72_010771 [Caenorhabditis remanei]KAF1762509.1 hypothetical protein GCK72_010771 [Caenorhabditis remanei]
MTINGIWEWANHVSQKVALETLRDKVLAIDGHIWLYESLKGCETHHQQTPNSYLITFFTRIQRLRELKIIPIVVFDSISSSSAAHEAADQDEFVPRKRRSFGDSPFTNLADHVIKTNSLLSHFGVKVIIAPGDGEAQCARLEELGVVSGCITTDFDYFLFGGKNLYRFDFSATTMLSGARLHDVTHLSLGRMNIEKKVARPHLIATAILLGCDYYQRGVQNIGIITVFDILAEFGDNGCKETDPQVILDRFSSYVRREIPARSEDSSRKLRLRGKKFNFPDGFPNCTAIGNAIKMYMQPAVSNQIPRITSQITNFQKVEEILVKECGWSPQRLQREVTTSMTRSRNVLNIVTQSHINEFFPTTRTKTQNFSPIVEPCISADDYISANNNWMRKRKRMDSDSPNVVPKKPVTANRKRTIRIRAPPPTKPYHDNNVITLDEDSD